MAANSTSPTPPTTPPPAEQPALPRVSIAANFRALTRSIGTWLGHESIPQMAAALAYRTIFSLIPILILSLLVLRLFQDERALVQKMLQRLFELLGITQISDSQEVTVQGKLEQLIQSFSGLSFTGIGIASALTLIYAAISLMIEVENSFNRIYGVMRGRSFVRRMTQYWMLLTLGPLLLFASFYTAEKFTAFTTSVTEGSSNAPLLWFSSLGGYFISVLISATLVLVLYLVIPNARVKLHCALAGALLAALALEAAKYGYRIYLSTAAVKSVYGSLAAIPLFLLWIYITWVIVLTGLRAAYLWQHGKQLALLSVMSTTKDGSTQSLIDPTFVPQILAEIALSFRQGKPLEAWQLASHVGLPEHTVQRITTLLVTEGLVNIVATSDRKDRYALARPAEEIPLALAIKLGYQLAPQTRDRNTLVESLRQAQIHHAASQSLADALPDKHTPANPTTTPTPPPATISA